MWANRVAKWGKSVSVAVFRRAAVVYMLIETARLEGVAPETWLADVVAGHGFDCVDELLPRNWKPHAETIAPVRTT